MISDTDIHIHTYIYMYTYYNQIIDWLAGFYGISTFVVCLMTNSVFTYTKPKISKQILRR